MVAAMTAMRAALVFVLIGAFAIPIVLALVPAFSATGFAAYDDWPRLSQLAGTTLQLVAGVLVLALPLGIVQAVFLFRTNLPLRQVFLLLNLLLLALPLPLHVMGWQAFLGPDGWLALWANAPGRSWIEGLTPAILIHAVAAMPWVVLIVGVGLRQVERELEEEASLSGGLWHVLWFATLPRCQGAILAAAGWVAIQTLNEVAVTDMLQVNTFAEEIRLRFILGGGPNLAQALALALPTILAAWVFLALIRPVLERGLFPLQNNAAPAPFHLGRGRWLWTALFMTGWLLVFFGPTIGLVERLGRVGHPPAWDRDQALDRSLVLVQLHGVRLLWTLGCAVAAGMLAALLALVWCCIMIDRPDWQTLVWSLAALGWAIPGPALGIGLKSFIGFLVDVWPDSPVEWLLYREGPIPILWAHLVRFFPCALAILWPVVRMTPRELRDAARLLGPWHEWRLAIWPTARGAFLASGVAVAALALGEVGAAALVANPGWDTFAKLLLDAMHTGLDNDVAALGLCLLAAVTAGVVMVGLFTLPGAAPPWFPLPRCGRRLR